MTDDREKYKPTLSDDEAKAIAVELVAKSPEDYTQARNELKEKYNEADFFNIKYKVQNIINSSTPYELLQAIVSANTQDTKEDLDNMMERGHTDEKSYDRMFEPIKMLQELSDSGSEWLLTLIELDENGQGISRNGHTLRAAINIVINNPDIEQDDFNNHSILLEKLSRAGTTVLDEEVFGKRGVNRGIDVPDNSSELIGLKVMELTAKLDIYTSNPPEDPAAIIQKIADEDMDHEDISRLLNDITGQPNVTVTGPTYIERIPEVGSEHQKN